LGAERVAPRPCPRLVFRAKDIPMGGGAGHVAKGLGNRGDEENEGFKGKQ
jgi:hypothetical protein